MKKQFIIFFICAVCLFLNASHAFGITNAGREKRDPKAMYFWEIRGFFVYLTNDPNNYDGDDQSTDDSFRNQPFIKISPKNDFTLGWALRMEKITGDGSLVENIPNPEKIAYKIRYGCGYSPAQVYRQTSEALIVKHSSQNVSFPITESVVSDHLKIPFKLNSGSKDCFCKIWIEVKELDSFGQYSSEMPVLAAANSRPIQVCNNPPVGSYPPVIEDMPAGFIPDKNAWDFQFIIRDMGNDPKVEIKRYIVSPEAARNLQFYGNFGEFEKNAYKGKIPHVSIYPPSGGYWPLYHTGYYSASAGFKFEYPYCYFFQIINSVQGMYGSTFCGFPNPSVRSGAIQKAIVKPIIDIQKINSAPIRKVAIKAYVRNLGNSEKVLATHQIIKTEADCDSIFEEEWSKVKTTPKVFSAPGEYPINWDFGTKDKGSRYCYRFVAANEGAKAIAGPFSFIVQGDEKNDILLVLPPASKDITDTSAVLSADVFKPEQIKNVYFSVWRTDKKGELQSPDVAKSIVKNFVSYKISDLVPGGSYEYNAKGTDANRREFWAATTEKFTTKPGKPEIIIDSSNISSKNNDASFAGHIEEFGGNPKVRIRVFLYPAETGASGLWACESSDGQVGNSGNVFDLGWRTPSGKTISDGAKFSYSLSGLSMSGVDRPYCFYFGATGSAANKSSYTQPTLTQKFVVAPKCTKPDVVRKPESFEISTRPNYSGNLNSDPMKVYFKWVVYDDTGKQIKNGFKATTKPDQEFKVGETATTSLMLSDIGKENAGKKVCVYAMAKNLITDTSSAISKENETCNIFPRLPEIGDLKILMLPSGEGRLYGKVTNFGSASRVRAYFRTRWLYGGESNVQTNLPAGLIDVKSIPGDISYDFDQIKFVQNSNLCKQYLNTGEQDLYKKTCAKPILQRQDFEFKFCAASDCLEIGKFDCEVCTKAQVRKTNTDLTLYSQLGTDKGRKNIFNERMDYYTCARNGTFSSYPCVGTGGQSGGCGDLSLAMIVDYFYRNNEKVANLWNEQYKSILNDSGTIKILSRGTYLGDAVKNKIFTYNYRAAQGYLDSTCSSFHREDLKCDDNDIGLTSFTPTPFRFLRWLNYNGSWDLGAGDWILEGDKNQKSINETFQKIGLMVTRYDNLSLKQIKAFTDKHALVAIRCPSTSGSHLLVVYKVDDSDTLYIRDPAYSHANVQYGLNGCGTYRSNAESQFVVQELP